MDHPAKALVALHHHSFPLNPNWHKLKPVSSVKFEANYPGELICDQTMPSLTFLSAVEDMKESDSYRWIPWKSKVSEQVQAQSNESRPPRTDRQLLRSIMKLEDLETIHQPSNYIPTSGPVESHLIKFQHLFAIALAMVHAAHLRTLKRFNRKFQQLALAVPRDSALRPQSIQEVLDADRAVWASIFAVKSENMWSLNDSLNKITFCRQELQGLAQPRLYVAGGPTKPPKHTLNYLRSRTLTLGGLHHKVWNGSTCEFRPFKAHQSRPSGLQKGGWALPFI